MDKLEKKIEELSKELEDLKCKLGKEKSKKCKRWRADIGEEYYYIFSNGDIDYTSERDGKASANHYDLGNYFQTKEEAEKVVEKIKIYVQLKDLALRLNKGKKIDWENDNQVKYSIYYDNCYKKIYTTCNYSKELGQIYCLDSRFLNIAKQEIGEEKLRKLFK